MALLKIRTPDGKIVEIPALPGAKGENGKDGYTPAKGKDYFTPDEQEAFHAAAKAYIDEKIAPATSNTFGTIKAPTLIGDATGYGFYRNDKGFLQIVSADEDQIANRGWLSSNCPITPNNLDYAVKAVGDGYYAKAEDVGDVEAALDSILAMQEALIGGGAE